MNLSGIVPGHYYELSVEKMATTRRCRAIPGTLNRQIQVEITATLSGFLAIDDPDVHTGACKTIPGLQF